MATQVNPQEIFLLEHYSSQECFGELRDTWEEMIRHLEICLDSFMQNLDPRYRSSPLPEQPDIVWGSRIIPNFRCTLQGLNTGFAMLCHGDVRGLVYASGPRSDFKGQMDYSTDWMKKVDKDRYEALLDRAAMLAHCIVLTEGAYWSPGILSNYPESFGPLTVPTQWPSYRLNRSVSVSSGMKTKQSGIYVPDVENSCAEFLSTNYESAPNASVLVGFRDLSDPETGEKYDEEPIFEPHSCIWYLVERTTEQNDFSRSFAPKTQRLPRVRGGETCPETGFYFTPSRPGSRQQFKKGYVMPNFDAAYGTTIWQWDSDQK